MEALHQVGLGSQRGLLEVLMKTAQWRGARNAIDLSYLARAVESGTQAQAGHALGLLVRYVNEVWKAQAILPDTLGPATEQAIRKLDEDEEAVPRFILAVEKRRTEPPQLEPLPSPKAAVMAELEREREREKEKERLRREREREREKEKLKGNESKRSKTPEFDFKRRAEKPSSPLLKLAIPAAVVFVACLVFLMRSGSSSTGQLPVLGDVGVRLTEMRREGPVLTARIADARWRDMTVGDRTDVGKQIWSAVSRTKGIHEVRIVDGLGGEAITINGSGEVKVRKPALPGMP